MTKEQKNACVKKVMAIRNKASVSDYILIEIIKCVELVNEKGEDLSLKEILKD